MTDLFTYNDGKDIIPDNAFRISPSQLYRFFDSTSEWYREFLLGQKEDIQCTAVELGNCVHAAADYYVHNQSVPHEQIINYINSITNPEIDKSVLFDQYPIMVSTLVEEFLIPNQSSTVETELFVCAEVLPGVVAAGSIDRYDRLRAGGTISDYKTMNSLDAARLPKSFPRAYYFQQLTYAWIMHQLGNPVEYLELIYITRNNTGRTGKSGKPLKDYPSQTHIIRHAITSDDMDFIESNLKLVAESVILWNSNPEYRHLLAQDYRLRIKTPPKLFIKD